MQGSSGGADAYHGTRGLANRKPSDSSPKQLTLTHGILRQVCPDRTRHMGACECLQLSIHRMVVLRAALAVLDSSQSAPGSQQEP